MDSLEAYKKIITMACEMSRYRDAGRVRRQTSTPGATNIDRIASKTPNCYALRVQYIMVACPALVHAQTSRLVFCCLGYAIHPVPASCRGAL